MTIALLRFLVAFYLEYFSPFLFVDVPAFTWWLWDTIPDYLPFYILAAVVLYAATKGRAHATVISPFHLPPEKTLPFSGATVANSLEDAFCMIRNEAEVSLRKRSGKLVGISGAALAGLKLPEFTQFEIPTRFGVEVKGLSHEALLSLARKVWKTERIISGDVVVHDGNFRLLARSNDAGPWVSVPRAITLDSIRQASRELALEMLADFDPAVLAAYEIARRKFEAAHKRLLAVVSKPEASETGKRVFEVAAILASIELDEQGKQTDSRNLLEGANRLLPKSALLAYNLGFAWQQSYESEALANGIASYQRALRLRPKFPETLNNLGVALAAKGQLDQAISYYQKAFTARPNYPEAFTNLGVALAAKGQLDQAISYHQKALAARPNYLDALNNLGTALLKKGRTDDAIEYFHKALAARPNHPVPFNNLGVALDKKGDYDGALAAVEKALKLKPDYVDALDTLGTVFRHRGQFEDAIDAHQKAVKLKPDHAEHRYNLGLALREAGREEEAQPEFAEAQRLDPKLKPPAVDDSPG